MNARTKFVRCLWSTKSSLKWRCLFREKSSQTLFHGTASYHGVARKSYLKFPSVSGTKKVWVTSDSSFVSTEALMKHHKCCVKQDTGISSNSPPSCGRVPSARLIFTRGCSWRRMREVSNQHLPGLFAYVNIVVRSTSAKIPVEIKTIPHPHLRGVRRLLYALRFAVPVSYYCVVYSLAG